MRAAQDIQGWFDEKIAVVLKLQHFLFSHLQIDMFSDASTFQKLLWKQNKIDKGHNQLYEQRPQVVAFSRE